jgi:hypothetical protein
MVGQSLPPPVLIGGNAAPGLVECLAGRYRFRSDASPLQRGVRLFTIYHLLFTVLQLSHRSVRDSLGEREGRHLFA